MTFGIHPIECATNQKGRTHDRQQQEQNGFANMLTQNAATALRAVEKRNGKEHHHKNDVVQLHTGLDFALQNLAGQVTRINTELSRTYLKP